MSIIHVRFTSAFFIFRAHFRALLVDVDCSESPRRFFFGEGTAELTEEERRAACLAELRECSDATTRVHQYVQKILDEFELKDDRKL